jgi:hypothetical protein
VARTRRAALTLLGGPAGASPLALRAQQKAMPVIGYLGIVSPGPGVAIIRQGLSETGYVEGQSVAIEYRWAGGRYDQLPALAADLASRKATLLAPAPISVGTASRR